MSIRMILCLAMMVLAWPLMAGPLRASAELAPGQPFPGLALPSLDGGKPLSIEDFRGRKIALHVFASW